MTRTKTKFFQQAREQVLCTKAVLFHLFLEPCKSVPKRHPLYCFIFSKLNTSPPELRSATMPAGMTFFVLANRMPIMSVKIALQKTRENISNLTQSHAISYNLMQSLKLSLKSSQERRDWQVMEITHRYVCIYVCAQLHTHTHTSSTLPDSTFDPLDKLMLFKAQLLRLLQRL